MKTKPKKLRVRRKFWEQPKLAYRAGTQWVACSCYADARKYARLNGFSGITVEVF